MDFIGNNLGVKEMHISAHSSNFGFRNIKVHKDIF